MQETSAQKSKRLRTGTIVATMSIGWWILSIGGVIWAIAAQQ